ncbi:MAG: hydrogenase nickel incorporation protein HypB [Ketobacteraceae bacterium]|nr:hydrogenase nickel incorporation protein HypB [Ketobacteraceae bacterium]
MCDTCGCSSKIPATLTRLKANSSVAASAIESSAPPAIHPVTVVEQDKRVALSESLLSANDRIAAHNREHFRRQGILALNLISAPGSGKTTLLENTLRALMKQVPCAVIEGDQATTNDAERIGATGCPVVQVNTGSGCHLEANMVHEACHQLILEKGAVVFIENVGNLVCPSLFDLGEACKVALLSVTEGDDKPMKYPHIFRASDLVIINKCDLLPYVSFDLDRCIASIQQLNSTARIVTLSATQPETLVPWLEVLGEMRVACSAQQSLTATKEN